MLDGGCWTLDAGRGLWLENRFSHKMQQARSLRLRFPAFWVRQMATDPFEKFERSRVGWTIPLALFIIGGGLTYFAVSSLHGVLLRELESAQATQAEQAAQGGEVQTANPVAEPDNGEADDGEPDTGESDTGESDNGESDNGESDEIGSDVGVTGAPKEK